MLYACAELSQGSRVLVLIFVNKIFVIGKPLTKITKIFLLEIFQLYGILFIYIHTYIYIFCSSQLLFFIIIIFIIINFFIRVFSEYTEAVTTSLIQIDVILPEICTSIVGFSCTAVD